VTRFVDLNAPQPDILRIAPPSAVQKDLIPQQRLKSKVVMVTRVDSQSRQLKEKSSSSVTEEDESSVDKSSSSFRSIIPSSQEDNLYMRKGIILPVLDFSVTPKHKQNTIKFGEKQVEVYSDAEDKDDHFFKKRFKQRAQFNKNNGSCEVKKMSSFDSFNYSRPNLVKYKHKKENCGNGPYTSILGLVAAPYETQDEE
jgi:ASC-1-like (ASCH) protein